MYGLTARWHGDEAQTTLVRVLSAATPADAQNTLLEYVRAECVARYGSHGDWTIDEVDHTGSVACLVAKKQPPTGWIFTSAPIILGEFHVLLSKCIAHSDHSNLVDRIAELTCALDEANSRAEVASSAAFSELVAEYAKLQCAYEDIRRQNIRYEKKLVAESERRIASDAALALAKLSAHERKMEYRTRQDATQVIVDTIRADAENTKLALEKTIEGLRAGQPKVPADDPPVSMSSLATPDLLREMIERPRLKTREERDAILRAMRDRRPCKY